MKITFRIAFFALLVLGTLYIGRKPEYNWDVVCYAASVVDHHTSNLVETQQETFKILQRELDSATYTKHTTGGYGETVQHNLQSFEENLSYYTIRVAYVGLIDLFYRFGVPLDYATVLPSVLSVFLIVLTLHFVLLESTKNAGLATLLPLFILFLPSTVYLGRLSTPDALSTLLLLWIAVLYLYKKSWWSIILMMALAIMTRTDNVLWCLSLLLLETVFPIRKKQPIVYLILSGFLIALYLAINLTHNNGGWAVVFYATFIERQFFPLTQTPDLSVQDYFTVLIKKLPDYLPWFLLVALGGFYLGKHTTNKCFMTIGGRTITVCVLFFIAKYILFPSFDVRFYWVLPLIILTAITVDYGALQTVIGHNKKALSQK